MSMEPPPFEEAARCEVCKCSFNAFRRRHHCRNCGRTFCNEHSSNQMALPQFGLHSDVRVCADCFNNSSPSKKDNIGDCTEGAASVIDSVSRLDIIPEPDVDMKTDTSDENHPILGIPECKCGMPLCICEAPVPSKVVVPMQRITTSTAQMAPKSKKIDNTPKNRGSTSTSKSNLGSVFNQTTNGTSEEPRKDYELNGEGLREAIKNSDTDAVRRMLKEGVDANYCDKQGMSLLHLAALFNQTDITFILMDSGASIDHKNAQGETPLDCAPAMLQYKMRQKIEEGA